MSDRVDSMPLAGASARPVSRAARLKTLTLSGSITLTLALVGCAGSSSGTPPASASPDSPPPASSPADNALSLVAIGDSIPNNSPYDCPNCTGFVEQYADAVSDATGRQVTVKNLSQHTGLTLPQLLDELESFKEALSGADVVIVGIAHNSNELAAEIACGKPRDASEAPDWSAMTRQCALDGVATHQPQFDQLYAQIADWRAGKPTILRTINRYNDYIGWVDAGLTPAQERITKTFVDPWSAMICDTAQSHGFSCADIYHAFNGANGLRPSGALLAEDYTHPSQAGNDIINEQLVALGFAPLG